MPLSLLQFVLWAKTAKMVPPENPTKCEFALSQASVHGMHMKIARVIKHPLIFTLMYCFFNSFDFEIFLFPVYSWSQWLVV